MKPYNSICAICFTKNEYKVVSVCNHFICIGCLKDCFLKGHDLKTCPLCRNKLTKAFLYKNNEKILTFDKDNCPHCILKNFKY